ncbi:hypothetical protein ACFL0V_03050 [Nanoarchaeota archaeon]
MGAHHNHHVGDCILIIIVMVVFAVWIFLKGSNAQLIPIGIMIAIMLFVGIAYFKKAKYGKAGNVKKSQKELGRLLHKDEAMLRRLKLDKPTKAGSAQLFDEYLIKEFAELQKVLAGTFDKMGHKKLAICKILIQIFDNMGQNYHQHAIKDQTLTFRKTDEVHNPKGKERRKQFLVGVEALEQLTKHDKILDYLKLSGIKNLDEHFVMTEIREVVKKQEHVLKNFRKSWDHYLKSNQIAWGSVGYGVVYSAKHDLTKYYELVVEELKLTEKMFAGEEKKVAALQHAAAMSKYAAG